MATQIEEEMKWKVKVGELESVSAMAELHAKQQQEDVSRERARLLRELEAAGKELADVRQQLLTCESSLQKEAEARSRLHSEWRQSEMEAAQLKDQLVRRAAECDQLRAMFNETVSQGGLKAHLSSEVAEMRARIAAMAERLARTEEEAAKANPNPNP
jgi:chromosome segregation ATPase